MMHINQETEKPPEIEKVVPIVTSSSLLECMADMETIGPKEFLSRFEQAEANLEYGEDTDILDFICLSLNEKADYVQFKHGTLILEKYLEDHPLSGKDLQGFRFLVNRLDSAIVNKWSSWKTLLNDKKALKAEMKSQQARIEELQQQIEQLKKIEDIIESREIGQP